MGIEKMLIIIYNHLIILIMKNDLSSMITKIFKKKCHQINKQQTCLVAFKRIEINII